MSSTSSMTGWSVTATSSRWAASCRLYLAGASDAAIVSGLVALLLRVYSGRSPAEILATDPKFLKDLGLLEALSTNRGSGVASMARRIREVAARAQPDHQPGQAA